ncbi:hypothetical protein M409DRAFT_62702 [Zasmidium cellare ATCC 36951]|uniref:RCC1/BLIP-II protein n=1 Tax=Zasmidium cellare ATCC 36951 TaxID=1080233 RepID=A0A6A6D0Y2_ZASCE|nr:uncharacterized protein M409DRAFT_62702 [Zasmidium cellare ATCC 36951]KAF2173094.1 hypothetical protein M409DRAFT_62702 [Zasmidium cellare ATCC 36951]
MPANGGAQVNGVEAVRLLAAGFNGHHQLFAFDEDPRAFTAMVEADATIPRNVLFAGWSTTVFQAGRSIFSLGHQKLASDNFEVDVQLQCGFGDHEGILGCLDHEGRLYLAEQPQSPDEGWRLSCQSTDVSPKIGTIAAAGNGRIALTFRQAPNGNLAHIAEFDSPLALVRWFRDPSGEGNYPACHHMIPGRPKQLLANTGSFILLMEGGEVYTWGDARYQSLGRAIGEAMPADKPGVVDALGGLNIFKIASGGWMDAALSADSSLYIWGATSPGVEGSIRCLEDQDQVALVNLTDSAEDFLDVQDVAVGDNHIAVISEGDRLFAVGENRNGQLGVGSEEHFLEEWQEVPNLTQVRKVGCGPKSTFVLTKAT